ncbi:unnamed protein product [Hydatigera taeniaeformis]|uniref:Ras family protein n=1 Tax=Hydatigena taeniaeformis TaxID=6205 RepID=A0A0R3WUU0_HYDTA|nr:unnamed protein product [Hydatigera taeniaeformis]
MLVGNKIDLIVRSPYFESNRKVLTPDGGFTLDSSDRGTSSPGGICEMDKPIKILLIGDSAVGKTRFVVLNVPDNQVL